MIAWKVLALVTVGDVERARKHRTRESDYAQLQHKLHLVVSSRRGEEQTAKHVVLVLLRPSLLIPTGPSCE